MDLLHQEKKNAGEDKVKLSEIKVTKFNVMLTPLPNGPQLRTIEISL